MTDEQLSKVTKFKVSAFSDRARRPSSPPITCPAWRTLKFTPAPLWQASSWAISRNGTIQRSIKDNPGSNLPNDDITVVHRSDGSGTTFVWTDYLSKVSPEWKTKVGANTSVNWPVGLGGKGNEGVAGLVEADPEFHRLCRTDLRGPEQNGVRFR